MRDPIAIIQARMGSTRFPGKVMADIGGKPMLRHVYDRVMTAKRVRFAVVATDQESEEIRQYCNTNGILLDIGDSDPYERMRDAGARFLDEDDEWAFRICADCPLIDPLSLDDLAEFTDCVSDRCAYIAFRRESDGMPAVQTHQGLPELFHWNNLFTGIAEGSEHVTRWCYEMPGQCHWIDHPCDENNTVDTPEDLERLRPRIEASSAFIEQAAQGVLQ